MSRRNKATGGMTTIPGFGNVQYNMPQGNSGGGGGSKLPEGTIQFKLGKKNLTISGSGIQTVTVPFHGQQQQQQSGQSQQSSGGNQAYQQQLSGKALRRCLVAAGQLARIVQQDFSGHQQAQAANQQLLTQLTQVWQIIGMPSGQMGKQQQRAYTNPQQQVQQTRAQKRQQAILVA